MGDPRVEADSPWRVLYLHQEMEELRVLHREVTPAETVRGLMRDLLATGRVPPMQGILPTSSPLLGHRVLQRLWGAVRQHGGRDYFIFFFNETCLVAPLVGPPHPSNRAPRDG